MGLLDQIMGAVGGQLGQSGEGDDNMLSSVMRMINNPDTGGFSGLLQSFKDGGLDETVKSWVSNGENLPISADQIKSVLDNEQIQSLADKFGLSADEVSEKLSEMLPQIVDKLTPGGEVPEDGDMVSRGLNMLKDRFSS